VCVCVCLFACLPVCLLVCLPACLSVCLSVYLSVCACLSGSVRSCLSACQWVPKIRFSLLAPELSSFGHLDMKDICVSVYMSSRQQNVDGFRWLLFLYCIAVFLFCFFLSWKDMLVIKLYVRYQYEWNDDSLEVKRRKIRWRIKNKSTQIFALLQSFLRCKSPWEVKVEWGLTRVAGKRNDWFSFSCFVFINFTLYSACARSFLWKKCMAQNRVDSLRFQSLSII
jgi:hypothetical protein